MSRMVSPVGGGVAATQPVLVPRTDGAGGMLSSRSTQRRALVFTGSEKFSLVRIQLGMTRSRRPGRAGAIVVQTGMLSNVGPPTTTTSKRARPATGMAVPP